MQSCEALHRVEAITGKTVLTDWYYARVPHIALNYLKGEKTFKGGVRRKQKKAALDETYLPGILAV